MVAQALEAPAVWYIPIHQGSWFGYQPSCPSLTYDTLVGRWIGLGLERIEHWFVQWQGIQLQVIHSEGQTRTIFASMVPHRSKVHGASRKGNYCCPHLIFYSSFCMTVAPVTGQHWPSRCIVGRYNKLQVFPTELGDLLSIIKNMLHKRLKNSNDDHI